MGRRVRVQPPSGAFPHLKKQRVLMGSPLSRGLQLGKERRRRERLAELSLWVLESLLMMLLLQMQRLLGPSEKLGHFDLASEMGPKLGVLSTIPPFEVVLRALDVIIFH